MSEDTSRDRIIMAIRNELDRQVQENHHPDDLYSYNEDDRGLKCDGYIDLYALAQAIRKAQIDEVFERSEKPTTFQSVFIRQPVVAQEDIKKGDIVTWDSREPGIVKKLRPPETKE